MITHQVSTTGFGVKEYTPKEIRELVYKLEEEIKGLPQLEVEIEHEFADGLYARKILIPAGSALTGRIHKQNDYNVMVYGDIDVLTENGLRHITGHAEFTGKAGIKQFGIAYRDTLWVAIHHTHLTDLDEIEKELFEEEEGVFDFKSGSVRKEWLARNDYNKVLDEAGISPEVVKYETEYEGDRSDINLEPTGLCINESSINGLGIFAVRAFAKDELVGMASVDGWRNQIGRYVNHSHEPNTVPVSNETGDIGFVAFKDIPSGEEITVNYRLILSLRGRLPVVRAEELVCQAQ